MTTSFPSLEKYNQALQNPRNHLSDPELKAGAVARTGLGLPLAISGGFALTYPVTAPGGKKYALRCFHKHSPDLERRYSAISQCLRSLNSPYFVDFEFQRDGIRIDGVSYPIVKMEWASGQTMGEFIEERWQDQAALGALQRSLRRLASHLEEKGIAHGDIQTGNVMVSSEGRSIRLVDYDGMYVDRLRGMQSAELGHPNFQHPRRSKTTWNPKLDRFPFLVLDVALRGLQDDSSLWGRTSSDPDAILFRRNDFCDPPSSSVFGVLEKSRLLEKDVKNLAAVCQVSDLNQIPPLTDFLVGKGIPIPPVKPPRPSPIGYVSAYPVLDGSNYSLCYGHIGDQVELVGRIVGVRKDRTQYGKPYVKLNFDDWRGTCVVVTIWSEGLSRLSDPPDESWQGRWVSAVGLMGPPYRSSRYRYKHIGVTITRQGQLRQIDEKQAKYRLSSGKPTARNGTDEPLPQKNREIVVKMKERQQAGSAGSPQRSSAPPYASGNRPSSSWSSGGRPSAPSTPTRPASNAASTGCLLAMLAALVASLVPLLV